MDLLDKRSSTPSAEVRFRIVCRKDGDALFYRIEDQDRLKRGEYLVRPFDAQDQQDELAYVEVLDPPGGSCKVSWDLGAAAEWEKVNSISRSPALGGSAEFTISIEDTTSGSSTGVPFKIKKYGKPLPLGG